MPHPAVPVALGVSGLIPFVAALGLVAARPTPAAALALALYSLAILAFLGGVHWGRALSTGRTRDYLVSVVPSLAGVAAFAVPLPGTLAALAALFALLGIYDVALYRAAGPAWFAWLRLGLSVVVVAALGAGAGLAPAAGLGLRP